MKKKRNHKKLRFRIWLYFILFTVFCVMFIWLVQTLLFEYNYRLEKGNSIMTHGELIYSAITEKNDAYIPDNYVVALNESGVEVAVVQKMGDTFEFLYPIKPPINSNDYNYEAYNHIVNEIDTVKFSNKPVSSVSNEISVMYYGRSISLETGEAYLILTCQNNTLTDVVNTLRNQLIITALVAIIVSFFISYLIAGRLSAPIDNMSYVAKKWAMGDNSVEFEGGDFEELNELATALNYAKSEQTKAELLQRDLLANITHDLKTPLTMIKAYAEKIRDLSGGIKEKRDKDTAVIIEETDRLTLLVNDILSLSKLQSYVDAPKMQLFNLSKLTETIVYRFNEALSGKGFKLVSHVEKDLYTFADEKKIEEVLYNLIGNSVNYTGEDKIVKIYLTSSENFATLEIIDSGKGIEKDKIDGIWEKYLRYSETHHRTVNGTGLGLSIVKSILDSHKIKYGVISKKDVGSNFYVKFKAEKVEGDSEKGGA